jgi:hypothetical protein
VSVLRVMLSLCDRTDFPFLIYHFSLPLPELHSLGDGPAFTWQMKNGKCDIENFFFFQIK